MTTYRSMTERRRSTPSFGIGKLMFAIVLAILVFLLGQSMVHHNFRL